MKLNEAVLRDELGRRDFELLNVISTKQNYVVEVRANKLQAVHKDQNKPIYMPIPVTLLVTVDSQSRIQKIDEEAPDKKAVSEAQKFTETLLANKQIGGLTTSSEPNPTHQIEKNDKGQQVIKRRNFSAF